MKEREKRAREREREKERGFTTPDYFSDGSWVGQGKCDLNVTNMSQEIASQQKFVILSLELFRLGELPFSSSSPTLAAWFRVYVSKSSGESEPGGKEALCSNPLFLSETGGYNASTYSITGNEEHTLITRKS